MPNYGERLAVVHDFGLVDLRQASEKGVRSIRPPAMMMVQVLVAAALVTTVAPAPETRIRLGLGGSDRYALRPLWNFHWPVYYTRPAPSPKENTYLMIQSPKLTRILR